MTRAAIAAAGLACAGLVVACHIDTTTYVAPGDIDAAEDAAIDSPPSGPHVVVTPETAVVGEGGQMVVRVSLSAAPATDAPIMVTPLDGARLMAAPTMVAFTTTNWNVERIVTLMAQNDDDAADNTVTVVFDGGGVVADGSAMVDISDHDLMGLIVSPASSLTVTEGGNAPIQVRLSARPTGTVQVDVAAGTAGVVGLSPMTLTFDDQNWQSPQAVTVSGTEDANITDDMTLVVFDPVPDGISSEGVQVTATDNDTINIEATPGSLGILSEGGGAHSFGVRLTQMPAGNVTVNVSATPAGEVNLTQTSLSFNTGNWSTAQMVDVSAPEDTDVGDEDITISLQATGLTTRTVTATIDDNDTQVIVTTPATSLPLTEGQSLNIDVHLGFAPVGTAVVAVASLNPALASVNLSQLTFTAQNFTANQQVRVTAVDDPDLVGGNTQVRFNIAADGVTKDVNVAVTDNDTQAIVVDATTVGVTEGASRPVHAHLAFQPAGMVTVVVASTNPTKIGAMPASLTFGPGDYGNDLTVDISGAEDADTMNEMGNVTFMTAGVTTQMVSVTVADNDSQGITVTPSMLTVNEGMSGQLDVRLAAAPAGTVTLSVSANPTGVVTLMPTTLMFDGSNWNMPHIVTVSAPQDADTGEESTTVTISNGMFSRSVSVTVHDDDILTPVWNSNGITATEWGDAGVVGLHLSNDPGGAVTITVGTGFDTLDPQPTQLSFNASNYATDQTVTVTAVVDDDELGGNASVYATTPGGAFSSLAVSVVDGTLVLGFRPPQLGTPTLAGGLLHAFLADTLSSSPGCLAIDKVGLEVQSIPAAGAAARVSLYQDDRGAPGQLLFADQPRAIVQGHNEFAIGGFSKPNYPIWVAIETTQGVVMKTKTGQVMHCSRTHGFGQNPPDPFNDGGVVFLQGGGNVGPVIVNCDRIEPFAVYVLGHDGGSGC